MGGRAQGVIRVGGKCQQQAGGRLRSAKRCQRRRLPDLRGHVEAVVNGLGLLPRLPAAGGRAGCKRGAGGGRRLGRERAGRGVRRARPAPAGQARRGGRRDGACATCRQVRAARRAGGGRLAEVAGRVSPQGVEPGPAGAHDQDGKGGGEAVGRAARAGGAACKGRPPRARLHCSPDRATAMGWRHGLGLRVHAAGSGVPSVKSCGPVGPWAGLCACSGPRVGHWLPRGVGGLNAGAGALRCERGTQPKKNAHGACAARRPSPDQLPPLATFPRDHTRCSRAQRPTNPPRVPTPPSAAAPARPSPARRQHGVLPDHRQPRLLRHAAGAAAGAPPPAARGLRARCNGPPTRPLPRTNRTATRRQHQPEPKLAGRGRPVEPYHPPPAPGSCSGS